MSNFEYHEPGIKAWTRGVPVETEAMQQLRNVAALPFIHKHIAVMPDVHWGMGSTIGSVIPTKGAIIPAAVGVDIGCGMMAVQTSLVASDLPNSLAGVRSAIERAIPVGGPGVKGSWLESGFGDLPGSVADAWMRSTNRLDHEYIAICEKHPKARNRLTAEQLGTLGTGNHFIEVCLDEHDRVWIMLHSGSRGPGNRIGQYFIEAAKKEMRRWFINLPDVNLSYVVEGSELFNDYVEAVNWAQEFARANRELMMERVIRVFRDMFPLLPFQVDLQAIDCHHNYVARENHFGANVWVTRKGAVRARAGDMGIIPGSMGERSFIVRGLGNADAFHSCSHGAGRVMSRTAARKKFTLAHHAVTTKGVECRKDAGVLDETPAAYKDIDAVMAAQADLVEVVHTLKQVVCVKG